MAVEGGEALVIVTPIALVPLWLIWIRFAFGSAASLSQRAYFDNMGIASVKNFYRFAPYAIMGWSTAALQREDGDGDGGAAMHANEERSKTELALASVRLNIAETDTKSSSPASRLELRDINVLE